MSAIASTDAPTSLSEAELGRARLFIEQTRDGLLGAVKLLTSFQWDFKPRSDSWSIAEIVEHVIAVQERVIGIIRQNLATAPAPPPEQDRETIDNIVINQFPNRLAKFPSPISSVPRFDKAGSIRSYIENCARLDDMLTSTTGLREHVLDSPPLKAISKGAYTVMDGYQFILAAAAHAERHTKQILEVIADGALPVQ